MNNRPVSNIMQQLFWKKRHKNGKLLLFWYMRPGGSLKLREGTMV